MKKRHMNYRIGKAGVVFLSGFTLIEIMLVVVIIGILSAMVSPHLAGRSQQARSQAAKSDINSAIPLALDLYEMDLGHYPESLDYLRTTPGLDSQSWRGPYLKKKPVDPWERPYVYTYPGQHNPASYDLYSAGSDGQAGTADDICNWGD
ncbi:MAG: type II secretion system major pseudopilin GspG [Candidatus Omnitrophica bacterium]|jgi:general secretion pathway protein G|nr:type II secretion system major pseudopilin GspG [Candidatus Omnitrophota bacterium]